MKTINTIIFCLMLSAILLLNSCAASKSLSIETSNTAKELNPQEGKALVYIMRPKIAAWAIGFPLSINNIEQASLYSKRFYLCSLDPGKYVFSAKGENECEVISTLEANSKYYLMVTPQMGWLIARCAIEQIDNVTGTKLIKKLKIVGMNKDAEILLNGSK